MRRRQGRHGRRRHGCASGSCWRGDRREHPAALGHRALAGGVIGHAKHCWHSGQRNSMAIRYLRYSWPVVTCGGGLHFADVRPIGSGLYTARPINAPAVFPVLDAAAACNRRQPNSGAYILPSHFNRQAVILGVGLLAWAGNPLRGQEFSLHTFERQQLTDVYYSEGLAAATLTATGTPTSSMGPTGSRGRRSREARDLPGQAATAGALCRPLLRLGLRLQRRRLERRAGGRLSRHAGLRLREPEGRRHDKPWQKHQVFDSVANESPQFIELVGDERPELVCTHERLLRLRHVRPEQAARGLEVSRDLGEDRAGAVRPRPGRRRRQRRRPAGHPHEGRLVRAAGRAGRRRPLDVARGAVRHAWRGGDVRLRRGWRRRQRRDHQPGRPRLRPGLVRADQATASRSRFAST